MVRSLDNSNGIQYYGGNDPSKMGGRIKKGGSVGGGSNSANNLESISGVRGRTAASFMIVNSEGKAVREVFNTAKNRELLGKVNPKYKVMTAGDYLANLNK